VSNFSLIRDLNKPSEKPKKQEPAYGIKYQSYELQVEGKDIPVLIPIRECENFENVISNIEDLTESKLKQVTRDMRGLYNKK